MTYPLFLDDDLGDPLPMVGSTITLGGAEGRHAAVVRRISTGELILVADGRGSGVRGEVVSVDKAGLIIEVREHLTTPVRPNRYVAVQALAKGDRSELAIEMLTELGVDAIIPWQASRSIVRWSGDRAAKAWQRWRSTVREATKQSRRLRVPDVGAVCSTRQLTSKITEVDQALVLHEDAELPLTEIDRPALGTIMIIVGPEGGITNDELAVFVDAGAIPVSISDGVLRTSTAGVVALAGLLLR